MRTVTSSIICNGIVLCTNIMIPEGVIDHVVGLRKKTLPKSTAMVFVVPRSQGQVFDTFMCDYPIGFIALDDHMTVIKCGVMTPASIKFINCKYWIECHPEVIIGVNVGDTVEVNI